MSMKLISVRYYSPTVSTVMLTWIILLLLVGNTFAGGPINPKGHLQEKDVVSSIVADPMFHELEASDFTPQPASPLLTEPKMDSKPTKAFPLWPQGAPDALGKEDKDVPTLTPYWPVPEKASGAAMVICPGGGYWFLAPHEGKDYANWLNQYGITCFVLKYRLGPHGYQYPAIFHDVARACD